MYIIFFVDDNVRKYDKKSRKTRFFLTPFVMPLRD